MYSSLTRNSIKKGSTRRWNDDMYGQKDITIPPYYCIYNCLLKRVGSSYLYQVIHAMFYISGFSWKTWKYIDNMSLKNTWKYMDTNCTLEYW